MKVKFYNNFNHVLKILQNNFNSILKINFIFIVLLILGCSNNNNNIPKQNNNSNMFKQVNNKVFEGLNDKYAVCTIDEVKQDKKTIQRLVCGTKSKDLICPEGMLMANCIKEYISIGTVGTLIPVNNILILPPEEEIFPFFDYPMTNGKMLPENYFLCKKIRYVDNNTSEENLECFTILSKAISDTKQQLCNKENLEKYQISKKLCKQVIQLDSVRCSNQDTIGDCIDKIKTLQQ